MARPVFPYADAQERLSRANSQDPSQVILSHLVAAVSNQIVLTPVLLDLKDKARPQPKFSTLDPPWVPTSPDPWVMVEVPIKHLHNLVPTGLRLYLNVLVLDLLHVLASGYLLLPVGALVVLKFTLLTNLIHTLFTILTNLLLVVNQIVVLQILHLFSLWEPSPAPLYSQDWLQKKLMYLPRLYLFKCGTTPLSVVHRRFYPSLTPSMLEHKLRNPSQRS